jgi:hypothetical protein
MMFTKRLRDGVRSGRITCSVRIWKSARVKLGGRYPMEEGHIVVESVEQIGRDDITEDLARRSGFAGVDDLLTVAQHGGGANIYLVVFRFEGAWE